MAIDLSALLDRGVIVAEAACDSRKQAILHLSNAVATPTGVPERVIFDAVMEREQLGSTGVGEGIAIPHARLDGIKAPVGALMRLVKPVDFEAVDERPCDLIFMLLAPMSAGADHLRALAQVSRAFRRPEIREAIRASATSEDIRAVLCRKTADTPPNVSAA